MPLSGQQPGVAQAKAAKKEQQTAELPSDLILWPVFMAVQGHYTRAGAHLCLSDGIHLKVTLRVRMGIIKVYNSN